MDDSRYKLAYKPPQAGRYTFFRKDADHPSDRSLRKGFKVVR